MSYELTKEEFDLIYGATKDGDTVVSLRMGKEGDSWVPNMMVNVNKTYVETNREAFERIIYAIPGIEEGVSYIVATAIGCEQGTALLLFAIGKVLGISEILPDPYNPDNQTIYENDAVGAFPYAVTNSSPMAPLLKMIFGVKETVNAN